MSLKFNVIEIRPVILGWKREFVLNWLKVIFFSKIGLFHDYVNVKHKYKTRNAPYYMLGSVQQLVLYRYKLECFIM